MKKTLTILLAVLLVLGIGSVVVLSGCGGDESGADSSNGEVATEDTSGGEVSEGDIGVPVYPDAKPGEDSAGFIAEKKGDVGLVVLYTDDDVGKVISWYKDQLSGKNQFNDSSMSLDGDKMGLYFYEEGGEEKAITIMKADPGDPGKTTIIITSQ